MSRVQDGRACTSLTRLQPKGQAKAGLEGAGARNGSPPALAGPGACCDSKALHWGAQEARKFHLPATPRSSVRSPWGKMSKKKKKKVSR